MQTKYGRIVLLIFVLLCSCFFTACDNPGALAIGFPSIGTLSVEQHLLQNMEQDRNIEPADGSDAADILYAPDSKPDLIVESIIWSPLSPSKGDTITITATVKNQGDALSLPSEVRLYVDGYMKKEVYLGNVSAGGTSIKEFTWIAQQGSHIFKIAIDEGRTVDESNETNNEKSIAITTLTPDLVVQSISWQPTGPTAGDNATYVFIVRNQGNGKAAPSFGYFYIDNEWQSTVNFDGIEPNGIYTSTLIWPVQAGVYKVKFVIDPNNRIVESDEDNNESVADFPPIVPDLFIKNLEWSPSIPTVGETVNFTVTIGNQGRAVVSDCTFYVYIGDIASFSESARNVRIGGTDAVTFSWVAQPGSHMIRIIVDPNDYHVETVESNNEATLVNALTVISADLAIDPITWLPEEVSPGDTLTFSVTVRNRGYGEAVTTRLNYFVNGEKVDSRAVSSLSYGNIQLNTFDWTVEEGSHTFKFVADANNRVNESNEDNNEVVVIYPVPPDLFINSITLLPAEPAESDNVTFTFTIENEGGVNAENTTVACYIDDVYVSYVTGGRVESGDTANLTFTWSAEFGDHNCRAVVDPFNQLFEANEANNEIEVAFSVGEKSVVPESNEPTTPGAGGEDTPDGPQTGRPKMNDEETKTNIWFFSLLGGGVIIILSYIFYEFQRRQSK
ncbi:CARDB domain-containing protein [Chloroflexota bacterium]